MSRSDASGRPRGRDYPANSWYVLATSEEVSAAQPLGRRGLDLGVVLYRAGDGEVVALEDRDAHRPYPLSLGRVEADTLVSGYSGFVYDRHGICIRVPTQPQVPFGARVRAFPVREQDSLVWVWLGDPALAGLRQAPRTPWLLDDNWDSFGDQWDTHANYLLLHENFADITHVAVVDPYISPPVLSTAPPPLQVEVSETAVSFHRDYDPAPVAAWHADAIGVNRDALHPQREEGAFVTSGLWVDRWDVMVSDSAQPASFRFTHAITPLNRNHTRHVWRVSRNFTPGSEVSAALFPTFEAYYRRVREILETMQSVIDNDGERPAVSVSADAAVLQIRKIVKRLIADEQG